MVIAAVTAMAAMAFPVGNACSTRTSGELPTGSERRLIEAEDLIGLREIGVPYEATSVPSPLSLSPDASQVAMQVRHADPETNNHCVRLILVPIARPARARVLAASEGVLRQPFRIRGLDLGYGGPKVIVPRWSPDGTRLAYLDVEGARTVIRIVRADGGGSIKIAPGLALAEEIEWRDGKTLRVSGRSSLQPVLDSLNDEGRRGWLLDARFWPLSQNRPAPPAVRPTLQVLLDSATGRIVADPDVAPAGTSLATTDNSAGLTAERDDRRAVAWTEALNDGYLAPIRVRLRLDGREVACGSPACGDGTTGLWWAGDTLLILKTETTTVPGRMALYRWSAGQKAPRRVLDTEALLSGCIAARYSLICLREAALRPKHLVSIDPASGAMVELYDPNPGFARLALGQARRLTWTDRSGTSTFGNLVLPPDHRPGQRHPLIVVSYTSRGFLRGGTGDEYPIQLFARAGYAVLTWHSVSRLPDLLPARDFTDYQTRGVDNATLRRKLFDLVDAGIERAVREQVIDVSAIGITGLSDGASTACYAIINSKKFKAASLSSGCDDPETSYAQAGPIYRDAVMMAYGFPEPEDTEDDFWRHTSMARAGGRISTPILIQSADSEFRLALQSLDVLRRRGVPIEMYVFPDEGHIKWQPAHRAAIYRRNLDWFDFWLRDRERDDPAVADQYARWREMRSTRAAPAE